MLSGALWRKVRAEQGQRAPRCGDALRRPPGSERPEERPAAANSALRPADAPGRPARVGLETGPPEVCLVAVLDLGGPAGMAPELDSALCSQSEAR